MRILAIETSCDETAIALLEIKGAKKSPIVSILGNALNSQIDLHQKYGGVFPMMAKREHARVLTPLLETVLREANELKDLGIRNCETREENKIKKLLDREGELSTELLKLLSRIKKPKIDCLAVTNGPGLEPALWVGINFAKALSLAWKIPLIPINHMEGHLLVALLGRNNSLQVTSYKLQVPKMPLLALLISGGHTELVLMKNFGKYQIIGQTRDDAVGEAFDKVARMLDLPYPGGPEISRLAEEMRMLSTPKSRPNSPRSSLATDSVAKLLRAKLGAEKWLELEIKLPRPMIHSDNLDFSFSGLKTAVLYTLKKLSPPRNPQLGRETSKLGISEDLKLEVALEFENAVTEVLLSKTKRALNLTKAKTFIIGGGVSANTHIKKEFKKMIGRDCKEVTLLIPDSILSTDNAIMIGLVAYFKFDIKKKYSKLFKAEGNLSL